MLNEIQTSKILASGLAPVPLDGKRVLILTPDGTRSGPMPMIFRLLCDTLLPRVAKLDFLIALGTHQPMSDAAQNKLYGLTPEDRAGRYQSVSIHNHHWERPDTFASLGEIPAARMREISGGLMDQPVPVALNRLVLDYDHIILYGPVFPHEVAGFSGGYKYLFPGIAADEIINLTHWLGALITNYKIIGVKRTPVRETIEAAAAMLDQPMTGVCSVVSGVDGLEGLFVGPVNEAWEQAADLSAQSHIRYVERPFNLAVSCMPEMYDDIWTGAKGMYKVEPAMTDGGEVIIYAPHIKEISYTHGKILDAIGYHVRDYFVKQWDKFKDYPGGVLAHSTHLKGMGTYDNGVEKPRVQVTLATGVPEERCRRLALGYRDPKTFRPSDYAGREREGILFQERAGETLFRLRQE